MSRPSENSASSERRVRVEGERVERAPLDRRAGRLESTTVSSAAGSRAQQERPRTDRREEARGASPEAISDPAPRTATVWTRPSESLTVAPARRAAHAEPSREIALHALRRGRGASGSRASARARGTSHRGARLAGASPWPGRPCRRTRRRSRRHGRAAARARGGQGQVAGDASSPATGTRAVRSSGRSA